jgi:adenine-specific DNA-methyltransferase
VKGFVPTPPDLVDAMVRKLFFTRQPRSDECLLDPGCGTGAFIHGVIRWCKLHDLPLPRIVGIESDPALLREARQRLGVFESITLLNDDFLTSRQNRFDYVIGNPPYVPLTGLTAAERTTYRQSYQTATGRFDLYLLFFEQALKLLAPQGRLVFITPEKFLYVQSAEPLRKQLKDLFVEEIHLIEESAFGNLITYPTITTVSKSAPTGDTAIRLRDGTIRNVRLKAAGSSWQPLLNENSAPKSSHDLTDAFIRISCGVATGADGVYVTKTTKLPSQLRRFAFPTVSGREITVGAGIAAAHSILVPYELSGALMPEAKLGALGDYLRDPERLALLLQRTCVARKPWYSFHENPPLEHILRPKILCKDIGSRPYFVVDEEGHIVPRHSVYYLVPKDPSRIDELCAFLNSDQASAWLVSHCQRAANGFIRLQSHVLKRMPLPDHLATSPQLACV